MIFFSFLCLYSLLKLFFLQEILQELDGWTIYRKQTLQKYKYNWSKFLFYVSQKVICIFSK